MVSANSLPSSFPSTPHHQTHQPHPQATITNSFLVATAQQHTTTMPTSFELRMRCELTKHSVCHSQLARLAPTSLPHTPPTPSTPDPANLVARIRRLAPRPDPAQRDPALMPRRDSRASAPRDSHRGAAGAVFCAEGKVPPSVCAGDTWW